MCRCIKARYIVLVLCILAAVIGNQAQKEKMFYPHEIAMDLQGESSPQNIDEILSLFAQSYRYLDRGSQSIVFVSEDNRYVLKCFFAKTKDHGKVLSFIRSLIPYYRKKDQNRKEIYRKKLLTAIDGYGLAFTHFRKESGLVAVHLFATEEFLPACTVYNQKGIPVNIDLDRVSFVVQHKAKRLDEIFSKKNAKEIIPEMEQLLKIRAERGIFDSKGGFVFDQNYGFVGEKAILLDAGRILFDEKIYNHPEEEIEKMKSRFHRRLLEKYSFTSDPVNNVF